MEYIAIARNIKMSPRKVRWVADGVKKQKLKAAFSALTVMNKRAADPIRKAIDSAIANAKNNFQANSEALTIKDIIVYEGLVLKRYHFAGRGRMRPYKRRSSHIRVILSDGVIKKAVEPKMIEASTKELKTNEKVSTKAKKGKDTK